MHPQKILQLFSRSPYQLAHYYNKFIQYLGWPRFIFLQFLGIFAAILNVLGFAAILPVLAILFEDKNRFFHKYIFPYIPEAYVPHVVVEQPLLCIAITVVVIYALKVSFLVAYSGISSWFLESFTSQVRCKIIDVYQQLQERSLEKEEKSKVLHLNNQVPNLTSYNWGLLELSIKLYILLFTAAFLLMLSIKLAFALVAIGVLIVMFLYPFSNWTRRTTASMFNAQHRATQSAVFFVEGLDTIRTLDLIKTEKQKLAKIGEELTRHVTAVGFSRQFFFSLPELIVVTSMLAILYFASFAGISAAFVIGYGYALSRFVSAINDFSARYSLILELQKSPEELYKQLDRYITPQPQELVKALPAIQSVEFKNVTVKSNNKALISNVSFSIKMKETTQLIGANGSGKSTALKCLVKILPYEGSILINNIDISNISPTALYGRIAYHGQDNFLFPGSILDNVLMGSPGKTEADALRLCHEIGIDIYKVFSDGFRHIVLEEAKNVSGGERQLICVIRTLLRDADIYILDEFANHLSEDVVRKISSYLERLSEKTVLIVSHHPVIANKNIIHFSSGAIVNA